MRLPAATASRNAAITGSVQNDLGSHPSREHQSGRHARAEQALGTVRVDRRPVTSAESVAANSAWWDADADDYHAEHGEFLGVADFVWCPEGLREADAGLLGDVAGRRVLEVGCGSAPCARWLVERGASAVGLDLSAAMLRYAAAANEATGIAVPLVRANAERLPFATGSFDLACSAFGAVPFVTDLDGLFTEVARVLRPGGRWVFAVTHPIRWIFPDDPGPDGLRVTGSYFDRTPYVEVDGAGRATYVEHHRTIGDFVRALTGAGLRLEDVIEPEWPEGHTREWGQWSPLRGALFPGTAIFCCRKLS
ncbi:MAG TPA: class I SAM-dependent methyltransferase [Actinophytocola sp.]|uniref:class I SAM-dependent methyltransferase n=1 Tax=Actinophytocola sp. TaxID=1872138 RepID=UPI002DDD5047|nr:class I SAM-dependent methyltransferase [Actinophytocola sp.]HEV2780138.1 class I SAM-dependent methyltransferase [Actinophytocola sp.]